MNVNLQLGMAMSMTSIEMDCPAHGPALRADRYRTMAALAKQGHPWASIGASVGISAIRAQAIVEGGIPEAQYDGEGHRVPIQENR